MDRVLIIDDDRELCALVQRALVAAGVDADCCHSGQSGLLHMEDRDYQDDRSEERRVGKECRSRWSPYH